MKCPHCKLENPAEAITCDCGYNFRTKAMSVATPKPPVVPAPGPTAGTRRCPFCAETILAEAIRCKHCHSDLRSGASGSAAAGGAAVGETLGVIMLLVPVAATLLVWFWVGQMNLLQGPGSTLSFLGIVTVIATAALGAAEANTLGVGSDADQARHREQRSGPVVWFFFIALLWVVGFPAWLYQRSRYGLKSLVVGGVVVALIFAGSLVAMASAIEAKAGQLRNLFGQ